MVNSICWYLVVFIIYVCIVCNIWSSAVLWGIKEKCDRIASSVRNSANACKVIKQKWKSLLCSSPCAWLLPVPYQSMSHKSVANRPISNQMVHSDGGECSVKIVCEIFVWYECECESSIHLKCCYCDIVCDLSCKSVIYQWDYWVAKRSRDRFECN